jgi:succinate dehydrogenase / fumarate reductase, flavoprotein subunit
MKNQSNYSCDVLIIGGGSAGLRAAIEAHNDGADVLIISKSKRGDPHTTLARGGINASLGTMDPEDNWMVHAADTLREGEFLADYERVEVLCKNAPDVINELVDWGARFHKEKDGRLTQRFFGAHTYRRTVFYEDLSRRCGYCLFISLAFNAYTISSYWDNVSDTSFCIQNCSPMMV